MKVRLDGLASSLRPGLTCDTEILAAERKNALVVPLQAVVEKDGKTGIIGGLSIEVDGVSEGTAIVSGPFQTLRALRDGDRVRVR